MVKSTKEEFKMEEEMVKEVISIVMEINLQANGKMIKNKQENINFGQEMNFKVNLKMDKWHLVL